MCDVGAKAYTRQLEGVKAIRKKRLPKPSTKYRRSLLQKLPVRGENRIVNGCGTGIPQISRRVSRAKKYQPVG